MTELRWERASIEPAPAPEDEGPRRRGLHTSPCGRVIRSAEQGRQRSPNQGISTNESVRTRRVRRVQGAAVPACTWAVGVSSTPAIARSRSYDVISRAVFSVRGGADDSAQSAATDDAPGEAPSVQRTREPFVACSSARTALISADEAAMVDDAARSLATRIRADAAEKRARARGKCLRRLPASPFTARRGGKESERESARGGGAQSTRDLRGRMRALWGSPCAVLCDIGGLAPAALCGL